MDQLTNIESVTSPDQNDEFMDNNHKSELRRVKQDMLECINKMESSGGDGNSSDKKIDESIFINDLRVALSKLKSPEKLKLLQSVLSTLEKEYNCPEKSNGMKENEKYLVDRIKQLEEEKENLTAGIEELDRQHNESIENILSLKNELQKKHQSLQVAYEKLYVDFNKSQEQLELLESSKNKFTDIKLTDEIIQTDRNNDETMDNIKLRVNEIIKNISIEKPDDNETIFEMIAKKLVDTEWKKEMLEREFNETNRELRDACEFRDSLQVDCCDLQGQIESLEHELQSMKLNLPSIPEGNEEIETMSSELKRLQLENDELLKIKITNNNEINDLKKQLELLQQKSSTTSSNVETINKYEKNEIEINDNIKTYEDKILKLENTISILDDKCKNYEANNIAYDKAKNDIEKYKNDLILSMENTLVLENKIKELENIKKNIDNGLSSLSLDKMNDEQLDDALDSQVDDTSQNDKKLLKYLQSQLEAANTERDDLEYDLLNMRKELDVALKEISKYETDCTLIRQVNEQLTHKNDEILQQLSAINLDSSQRIDDLQLQIDNLQQEHTFLQEEREAEKVELIEIRSKCYQLGAKCLEKDEELHKLQEKYNCLENDYLLIKKKSESDDEKIKYLENELSSMKINNNEDNKQLIDELNELKKKHEESELMAKETIEKISKLINEKEEYIESKKGEYESLIEQLNIEKNELVRLVQVKHNESLQYHAEIQRLTQLFTEQTTKYDKLIAENKVNIDLIKEKETQVLWAQNELQVVRKRLTNFEEKNNYGETCNVPEHTIKLSQVNTLNEKCNALEAALVQEQSNNRLLQNQLNDCQLKETNAEKELERLRTHLVEMEASYTEEALIIDQSKQELEARLLQAEEKVQNSSNVYTSASIRANQQVETLQQQMTLIVQQRDEIQAKLSAADDKVASQTASLTNLQIVLEQFQRDKETDIRNATEKIRQQLNSSFKKQEELTAEISSLKTQLAEAKECLQAASRLSEQLEKKSERIEELKREVDNLNEFVNTADEKIQEAKKCGDGKVDKNLVKNLLLGLISSSASDKSSVLRVFSTVLEFNDNEKEKAGLNHPTNQGGWFSNLLGGANNSTKDQEASLSAAFVRFLESESKPMRTMPALQLTNTQLSTPGHSRKHSTSSQSGLLLSNVTLPSFPDFVPSRNEGSILKEVLKDN
ncbi:thyroid receptor-interacting protein 11 isoform X2 [Aphidius gifuensis]|nr:thyroid receptor-interacting protein 11 isoform X2 [Aphidius gifuensis]